MYLFQIYLFIFILAKCIIPCLNGGRCKGINKCRCPRSFRGDHCEIGLPTFRCTKTCRHGICYQNDICLCDQGWTGRTCNKSNSIKIKLKKIKELSE